MTIGTRSVLFGAHCFFLHPLFVAAAWTRLYGFPWDPRLWVAFFVHDLGYLGKPNMDGDEGEMHPILGARIMGKLFGPDWHDFTLFHSRFYAKRLRHPCSRLCVADKYSLVLTPWWLYLPTVWLTGELQEYQHATKYGDRPRHTARAWFAGVQAEMKTWCERRLNGDWVNGFDSKDVSMNRLPGYLEGGFEPSRYKVSKADGSHNPDAKYLVIRYDNDPHAIRAALCYAASVYPENPELALGIIVAVQEESGLDLAAFNEQYGDFLNNLVKQFRGPSTPEGVAVALELGGPDAVQAG